MFKLEFHVGNPGMTVLHRAALAGLYMTLKYLKDASKDDPLPHGITPKLTDRSVSIDWQCSDLEAIGWLLDQSFRLDKKGMIDLPGLRLNSDDSTEVQTRLSIHQGIRGTFLQHPSTFKSAGNDAEVFDFDGALVPIQYQKGLHYAHQKFAATLCDPKTGMLKKEPIAVAGWLTPGAVVRHSSFSGQTAIEELPENAFLLLFTLVGCQYFVLRSRFADKRSQYALIIPDVHSLSSYAKMRKRFRRLGYKNFHAAGVGDAGLKFLTYESSTDLTEKNNIDRCQVISFGTVAWSSQQRTRTYIGTISPNQTELHNYRVMSEIKIFENVIKDGKNGKFLALSLSRELIAENLARGKPWWWEFADRINNQTLFNSICYESGGLFMMVQDAIWDEASQKIFVEACHEAIRNIYGQIASRAKNNKEFPNFERERERIRTGLMRCKNADSFQDFITDFWSRAGHLKKLQGMDGWQQVLPLVMDEKLWKQARSLTLLALASYKSQDSHEVDSTGA
jgi:CRISPR-associated protein Cas8a1/Csx13